MPNLPSTETLTAKHPSRPLPWLPWVASGLFIVGALAVLVTVVVAATMDDDSRIELTVVDAQSRETLANARVEINGTPGVTDENGEVPIDPGEGSVNILVAHDGYRSKSGDLTLSGTSASLVVPLRAHDQGEIALANTATGNLSSAADRTATQPAGATDDADASGTEAPTEPAPVPGEMSGDTLASPPAATPEADVVELAGVITDAEGEPVQGALITDGSTTEVTGADGLFSVSSADVEGDTLRVSASGYADQTISFSDAGNNVSVKLDLQPVKAIYFNPNISDTEEDVDRLIELINTTEVNAVVIDVKEELIFYDSQVEFFNDVGTVNPIIDVPALLDRFEKHNIYTIARHVVFKDSLVAERRPDLAVMNSVTGDVWRDMNGVAWVNPMLHALWDANIELAVELGNLGFDEIQYDYVRFPTDGDLSTMEFGLPYTEENRVTAIRKFLKRSQEALLPTGAKLSADVFGFTVLRSGDLGIGQDVTELAPYLDYLSPMVYPSHFPDGALGLPGHPNDFPYETIEISMSAGKDQLGSALKLRPWLQDFDFFDMTPYGVEEVRAQIDAAEKVGVAGWMLWDPNNAYTDGALGPDNGNMKRFAAPAAVLPATATPRAGSRRMPQTPASNR